MKIREPTKKEVSEIARLESKKSGVEIEQVREWLSDSFISVVDDYITDCPGYAGKVISVVWSGSPNIYNVYTVSSSGLVCQEPELT